MVSRIPLGNICDKKIDTLSSQYDGKVEYIDISSIDNVEKVIVNTQAIDSKEAPSRARQLVKNGDILVSTVRPNLNAVAVIDRESNHILVASTGYCVLRCNSETDNHYVFHFCQSPYFIDDMVRQATGASYPAVSSSIVRSCLIPSRSLEEQRCIATVLDKLADLISLRKQQLAKLDELVKARFVEMFGDPCSNSKNWPQKRFDSLCENLDSRRIPITASERKAGEYPYYGASGIVDYVDDYIFDEDILLISEDGANLIARVTPIAFSVSGKVWVNNHAHVVRFKERCTQAYIEYYFALIDISDCITGTAQPKLNQAKLNAIMIPIPDLKVQERFHTFTKTITRQELTIRKRQISQPKRGPQR